MPFRVRIDPIALRQIDQFAACLRDYSEDFSIEQIERLDRILHVNRETPLTWSYFPLTGAPYRGGYLFRVGRQHITGSFTQSTRDSHGGRPSFLERKPQSQFS